MACAIFQGQNTFYIIRDLRRDNSRNISFCPILTCFSRLWLYYLFLLIVSILLYYLYASKKSANIHKTLTINCVAVLGVALGILAFIVEISNVLFRLPLGTHFPSIRNYAYELFSLFSISSPFLMILFIFSFPIKLLINELFPRKLKAKNDRFDALFSPDSIKTRKKIMLLALFCMLSVAMVLIPHQPTINKDNQDVGVDTHYYVDWINILIQSNSATEFLRQAFIIIHDGDRPLALLFLYSIIKIINADPSIAIEYIPVIFGPALVLVTYFLTRELTSKNDLVSLLAAFLTAVSFHTLIGIYAGFYANWFAIIIGYLSFVFFFRFLKMPNKKNFVLYSILFILLLLSHVYTWTILALVTVIFLLIMLKLKYYHRRNLILLLLVVFCCALIDIGRTFLTGSSSGFEQDMQVVTNLQGGSIVDQFGLRWSNLMDTLTKYGGLFSNFIILILGVFWIFLANLRQQSNIFLFCFLSVGILPLFFGNWIIQSRVFYDIPFQIPAAIALAYIKKQENGNILFIAISIWLVAIAIRAVAHFYFIAPLE